MGWLVLVGLAIAGIAIAVTMVATPRGERESNGGGALVAALLLAPVAGLAAWYSAVHWLVATSGIGGAVLLLSESPIINRAAIGAGLTVTLFLWALIAGRR